jgi:tricorn protease
MPEASYVLTVAGPEGSVFIGESADGPGLTLHKFTVEEREAEEFVSGVRNVSVSADGQKMLVQSGAAWRVVDTSSPPAGNGDSLAVSLQMRLDRRAEWRQIFDEAWRYERDYFYDPGMHGNDWQEVRARYGPLVPYVRHRTDLSYLLDQVNGELAVGHSFVFGGDFPQTDDSKVGLLGADLVAENGRWKIARIYTFESWNPDLVAPLDRPGLKVREGHYLLAVNGVELTAADDPYRLLDGTEGRQTVIRVAAEPRFDESWTETVEPVGSEQQLRQLAWVEDNRRLVDELSDGKLGYVWIPNTAGRGVVSFNRYFFAQQDRLGAVIDERFNGGGLLDDYMVDLMTRSLRAAITNEVPGGRPFRLPAGILGPKVLLINELAGSGGDYFPWVFRQQQAGPLIGTRTWGGLVKSSVHYALVDGGALTAPDNAVFDPVKGVWIAENQGVPPDIEVRLDARSVADGRDPQLERGVEEALRLLEQQPPITVAPPPFPRHAARPK